MKYRVLIQPRALRDLRSAYLRTAQHAPQTAARWLGRFQAALQSLSSSPERCPLAPESDAVDQDIRQLLFGQRRNVYRALFIIRDSQVHVLHIRRAAMDVAGPEEFLDDD